MKEQETLRLKTAAFFFAVTAVAALILVPLLFFDSEFCIARDRAAFTTLKESERDRLTLGDPVHGMTDAKNRMYTFDRNGKPQGFVFFASAKTLTSDISFAILYAKDGIALSASVLGVSGPGHQWLNDFRMETLGKWLESGVIGRSQANGQIDAVSGATETCAKISQLIREGHQVIVQGGI